MRFWVKALFLIFLHFFYRSKLRKKPHAVKILVKACNTFFWYCSTMLILVLPIIWRKIIELIDKMDHNATETMARKLGRVWRSMFSQSGIMSIYEWQLCLLYLVSLSQVFRLNFCVPTYWRVCPWEGLAFDPKIKQKR